MQFQRAHRQRTPLKVALTGPSGSGKTYGALLLAFGFLEALAEEKKQKPRIAVVDTENGSSNLYAHLGEFDVLTLEAPFTVAKYTQAIDLAIAEGYDLLVLDSLSHAWAGEGGLLQQKERLDLRGGNQYTNWAGITKEHEALKSKIVQAPIHIIATMRSKQDYIIAENGQGKSAPKKVGMAPIQREGMEYEFTLVLDYAMDHSFLASKDRTELFPDGPYPKEVMRQAGRQIAGWHTAGDDWTPPPSPMPKPVADLTYIQKYEKLAAHAVTLGLEPEGLSLSDTNEEITGKARALKAKIAEAEKAGVA